VVKETEKRVHLTEQVMSLKEKTLSGLAWSFADGFTNQGSQILVGIILARLLSPKEFGLIGMIYVFVAISQSATDSGFSQALIRKNDCTQADYSTVFYFNLAAGVLCYAILFLCAGPISRFFKEPQLLVLVRVLGIAVVINSMGLIQRTILTKTINFKLQTKISVIASTASGIIGIGLAYYGWGIWSLVWKTLSQSVLTVVLLWTWSKWKPVLAFCFSSFCEMFGFGSKLLVSGLIDTISRNIYYVVIGRYFSAADLGYYTRADTFSSMPSANLMNVVGRVSYPVLAQIKNDTGKLKTGYELLIKNTMFVSFVVMIGIAAVARPLVLTLLGEKWLPSVPYLRLLCFAGMLYPLHALNLDMLKVKGRSDLFLRLEVIKKLLIIPTIVLGVVFGIKVMILAIIGDSVISYLLNGYWSGMMVNYPVRQQVADLTPLFVISLLIGGLVFLAGNILPLKPVLALCVQLAIGTFLGVGAAKLFRLDAYKEIRGAVSIKFNLASRL